VSVSQSRSRPRLASWILRHGTPLGFSRARPGRHRGRNTSQTLSGPREQIRRSRAAPSYAQDAPRPRDACEQTAEISVSVPARSQECVCRSRSNSFASDDTLVEPRTDTHINLHHASYRGNTSKPPEHQGRGDTQRVDQGVRRRSVVNRKLEDLRGSASRPPSLLRR